MNIEQAVSTAIKDPTLAAAVTTAIQNCREVVRLNNAGRREVAPGELPDRMTDLAHRAAQALIAAVSRPSTGS